MGHTMLFVSVCLYPLVVPMILKFNVCTQLDLSAWKWSKKIMCKLGALNSLNSIEHLEQSWDVSTPEPQ